MSAKNVLVVSPDTAVQQVFATFLAQAGISTFIAATKDEARSALDLVRLSLVFCSDELDGDGTETVIRAARRSVSRAPVVVLTRVPHWASTLYFLGAGAFDYLLIPPTARDVSRITWRTLGASSFPNIGTGSTNEMPLRRISAGMRDSRQILQ